MRRFLLILCAAAGCQPLQTAPVGAPPVVTATSPPVPAGPTFVAPAAHAEPAQLAAPGMPVSPASPHATIGSPPAAAAGAAALNPVYVPVTNHDWAWEQILDVVDDYFRVERENRVQLVGNVVTEGRIDTFPQVGATWLEPHRPDSVGAGNRWESTLQTIRRRAVLRVIPQQGGYLVDTVVYKEREDLPRPEHATAGAATFRYDNSMPSRASEAALRTRFSQQWLPLGRDPAVEQEILMEIHARLTGAQSDSLLHH